MKFFKKQTLSDVAYKNDNEKDMIEEALTAIKNKFPIISVFVSDVPLVENSSIATAATDGNTVYYNRNFLKSLTPSQRQFVLAHEYLHIHFNHVKRGENKDQRLWNIATDAVINAKLEEEKFEPLEEGISMEQGKTMSADEIYDILKANPKLSQDFEDVENHNIWDYSKSPQSQDQNSNQQKTTPESTAEKEFSKLNDKLKGEIAKQFKDQLLERQEQNSQKGFGAGDHEERYGQLEDKKAIGSWKKLLRREVEKEEDRWNYRRANEDNYFQAGISSLDSTDMPLTEVLLDTSGSVSEELVREFLIQLKPLLSESRLKVGCFDTKFYGFVEIKSKKDIDNFVVKGGGGTDFNEAARHFSKDKRVNKIVFTDGYDEFTLTDSAYKNIIWLVFENRNFVPSLGRVINVDVNQIISQNNSKNDEWSY